MFDARSWLAGQIECCPDDLRLVKGRPKSDWRGAEDARYEGPNGYAGRVMVTPPRTLLGVMEPHKVVTGVWPGGGATARISADEQVVWE